MRVTTCDDLRLIEHDQRAGRTHQRWSSFSALAMPLHSFTLLTSSSDLSYVVCGNGGNGTDGLMAAQVLSGIAELISVIVLATEEKALSPKAAAYALTRTVKPIWIFDEAGFQADAVQLALEGDLIIDAVIGTGFKAPLEGITKKAVEAINHASGIVVSITMCVKEL